MKKLILVLFTSYLLTGCNLAAMHGIHNAVNGYAKHTNKDANKDAVEASEALTASEPTNATK